MRKDGVSPIVSVLLPLYNAEIYVKESITSILVQTFIDFELIVVNDGSTDSSLFIVEELAEQDPRIKIISRPNTGIVGALNDGLKLCSGKYITKMDADDLYPVDRLFKQVNWLEANSQYGAICGGLTAINEKGKFLADTTRFSESKEVTGLMLQGGAVTSFCTFMVRSEILKALGGFRTFFISSEDIDMQFRLAEACRVWCLKESMYFWRIRHDSITHNQGNKERDFFEKCAKKFQQQRINNGVDDLMSGVPISFPSFADDDCVHSAAVHVKKLLVSTAWNEYSKGNSSRALYSLLRGVLNYPFDLFLWRSLVVLFMKVVLKLLK